MAEQSIDVTRFRSKVDAWLVVVIVAAIALGGSASIEAVRDNPAEGWLSLGILAAVLLGVGFITIPTRYECTQDQLIIQSGVIRSGIPLSTISEVKPTRNPLASPAWSLDRLRVEHSRGAVLISPVKRYAFIDLLGVRANMVQSGEGLVRREEA